MKTAKTISLLFTLILTINNAFAGNSVIDTTTSFTTVSSTIEKLQSTYASSEILVVLDIDNTLLTSTSDLGGDIWYQWQRGKLNYKPSEKQKVDCLFEDAIALLYELGTMKLTDTIIPDIINTWQNNGITLFALTSRSPKCRAATERELLRKNIDFSRTAIRPKGEDLPIYRYNKEREISYMKGIMMTSGQNKGEMLYDLLQRTGCTYKAVVFVDDSEKNVNNMKEYFANSSINFNIFFYNKIVEDRKLANGGELLTKKQVKKMDSDWKKLNKTLKSIYPERYNGKCLNIE